jgi:ParB-like nuclease domain
MTSLRKITPLAMPANLAKSEVTGKRPVLRWIAPTELLVDATYQRDLSRTSLKLIRRMVAGFAWCRMKPPIVVEVASGFHIIDGQHTAIAAATIGLKEIPIFVVEADALDERARAFVGHNTDRITVAPIALWRALVAAGDPDASDVANVCKRAGVKVCIVNQSHSVAAFGETMAIGTVSKLVKRRGVIPARRVLEVLVKAQVAPIGTAEIRAAEELICEQHASLDAMIVVVRLDGRKGLDAAHARARAEGTPLWRALAARWAARLKRAAA